MNAAADPATLEPDLARRFGGLERLYGEAAYRRIRAARIAVVGLGGVGSWAAEALARNGVAALWLIDLDHVAESNINRQVQALGATVGQAKAVALAQRIADIHPGCELHAVEEFVDAEHWPGLVAGPIDALVDACDEVRAKAVLAAWGRAIGVPVVCVGAAGGKRRPQAVEVADLAEVTHDPLLAMLRQRLRQQHGAPRGDVRPGSGRGSGRGKVVKIGVNCVFSREAVQAPQVCETVGDGAGDEASLAAVRTAAAAVTDGSLNCHGYGSSVTVTATFGMVAAQAALDALLAKPLEPGL